MRPTALPQTFSQTILVVDDTPANVDVVADCLEDLGFLVVVAHDGEEAIKRAQFARPNLILLDVMMPNLNGYDTCRRLKEMDETKNIPIIFLSSLSDVDDKLMGFSAGAVDYVVKPFQIEEVKARVQMHLAMSELQQKLVDRNSQLQEALAARSHLEADLCLQQFSIDNANEAILWLSNEGHIVYVNNAGCVLFKNEREDLLSQDFSKTEMNGERQNWSEFWGRLKDHRTQIATTVLSSKNGILTTVECIFNYVEYRGLERAVVYLRNVGKIIQQNAST